MESPRVGIIGGGQLAQMLGEAALPLGLDPSVLVESLESPAAQVPGLTAVLGDRGNATDLRAFLADLDVAVFENEFVDVALLRESAPPQLRFIPDLDAIEALQDKIRQKEILAEITAPAARFDVWMDEEEPAEAWVARMLETFGGACVLKWSRMGYDGHGVKAVETGEEENGADFCEQGRALGARLYAEERIAFRRELALAASFSVTGEFRSFPLVISHQEHNICDLVVGPAAILGVDSSLDLRAQKLAEKLARHLPLTGTFALELFETEDGRLLVNEIAPRVHNSAHYTQDACPTSQFENHWRAAFGLGLGDTEPFAAFAMLNLLGPDGVDTAVEDYVPPPPPEPFHLHWYGKTAIRPRRKLGHLNASMAPDFLDSTVAQLKKYRTEWEHSLKSK